MGGLDGLKMLGAALDGNNIFISSLALSIQGRCKE